MARALWSGSLSFGLVNVPVALHSATQDLDVHFHQLHEKDGARIETRRWCTKEDEEVPFEEIGHAYDLDGEQVVLTDEELEGVAPERTRTIEIGSFVDTDAIDPVFYDRPYWVVPTGESQGPLRAYRLLVETMGEGDRVALGRFVLRTKEHLVAVRVRDGLLQLSTMRFAAELRDPKDVDGGGAKPAKEQLEQAVALIDALTVDFDASAYEDRYRKRLRDVVRRKEKGQTIKVPDQQDEPAPTGDLMAALQATLAGLKGGDKAAPKDSGGDDLEDLSKDELYERAADADVPGRSGMSKKELVQALRDG